MAHFDVGFDNIAIFLVTYIDSHGWTVSIVSFVHRFVN